MGEAFKLLLDKAYPVVIVICIFISTLLLGIIL